MNRILINALGIESSGGLTILRNTIEDLAGDKSNIYYCFVYKGKYIDDLINSTKLHSNIKFLAIRNFGIFCRVIFENLYFPYFAKKNRIILIYNFSGSNQLFFRIPSLVKLQNLLFYTKSLDTIYFRNNFYFRWFKDIYLKRFIFLIMIKKTKYFEIQSSHVSDELENFINLKKRSFFIKNDFLATRDSFKRPKYYNLNNEITFLYIVGPHFEMLHKNITDFIQAMLLLLENDINFKIKITLTNDQLNKSKLWDKRLNKLTTFLGYIDDNESMLNIYKDNTVLISTSVIETLGLHVIEASQNGVLSIVPKEQYSDKVYGNTDLTYNLFDPYDLFNTIMRMKTYNDSFCRKIITDSQDNILKNEASKFNTSHEIFQKVITTEE